MSLRDITFKIETYDGGKRVYVQNSDNSFVEIDFADGIPEPITRLHMCIA